MPYTPETSSAFAQASADSSSILDQISEIQDEAKKNKVQLTPEVKQYIREHLDAVRQKLANREEITEDDMKFMQDVRLWISLQEEMRRKYRSIEEMKQSSEVSEAVKEASARGISPKQWFDLLHIATVVTERIEIFNKVFGYPEGQKIAWIDKTFEFPGNGRIKTVGQLKLSDYEDLTRLPDNLTVNTNLNLSDCISLTSLPSNLTVGGFLSLKNCTSLTHLPDGLSVRGDLDLTKNLKEQVIQDAKRLKKEGKIKGQIKFRN